MAKCPHSAATLSGAEQLRHYINQLASSGRRQSADGNFGVGAKVAAGSRNLTDSNTAPGTRGWLARVLQARDPDGRSGLEPQR